MGYFKLDKLDKLDKIVIAFTFIIVTFTCIFNTFCFGYEKELQVEKISNLSVSNGVIVEGTSTCYYAFPLKKGVEYTFVNLKENIDGYYVLALSTSLDVGSNVTPLATNSMLVDEFSFVSTLDGYVILTASSNENVVDINDFKFVYDDTSYSGVVKDLSSDVGISQIWGTFDNSVKYISIVVFFALGVWFIKHNIIEHSKGRDF